jgi:signal transduction histidine kinase/CheY-like chemotaxis protein
MSQGEMGCSPTRPYSKERRRYAIEILVLALLYYGNAAIGLRLETAYGGLTPIWPPSGLAVAIFLVRGRRYWPVLALGEFATALTLHQSPLAGLIGGLAQILEALLAVTLLRHKKVRDVADSARSVLWFALLGAAIPPLASSAIGATSLRLMGYLTADAYPSGFLTWWLGDAIGILVLTPVLVHLVSLRRRAADRGTALRLALYAVALVAAGLAIALYGDARSYYLFFLLIPLVVVAAIRFGLAGAGATALVLMVIVYGMRPEDLRGGDFLTAVRMAFVGISAFTGYLVAGFMAERAAAEAELREMHAAVEQAKKMQAIGTLAGGIAHDFNNILSGIMGYADLAIAFHLPEESAAADDVRQILVACRRAADLVRQILSFSRSSEVEPQIIDAVPVVEEVAQLYGSSLPPTVALGVQVSATNTHVRSAPTQIHQILMNLLTNAGHAIPDARGRIDVRLSGRVIGAAMEPPGGLAAGEYLEIAVADTGVGMEPAIAEKIFEPYFTTKGPGKGTGLGLSVVHGTVKELGGRIEVESAPGAGTTVRVLLPAAATTGTPEEAREVPLPRGSEAILYVDDNPLLTDIAAKFLGGLGYAVTTCDDGVQAARRFEASPDAFRLVVTDLWLPGMTGLELARAVRAARPELPVILSTGNPDNVTKEQLAEVRVRAVAKKPLNLRELAALIREELDRAEP